MSTLIDPVFCRPAGVAPPSPAVRLATTGPLHPLVWRARTGLASGRAADDVWPSGWAALDAELPGGGWPGRALTELLLPAPGLGELRLLAPLLARLSAQGRALLWVQPPALLSAAGLLQMGCAPEHCVVVRPELAPPRRAVRKGHRARLGRICVGPWSKPCAVAKRALCWPGCRPTCHKRPCAACNWPPRPRRGRFLWRPESDAAQASPAPLRLRLQAAGPDLLALTGVKRRGPRWTQPLLLPLPAVLSARGLGVAQAWAEDAAAAQINAPLSAQRLRQRAAAVSVAPPLGRHGPAGVETDRSGAASQPAAGFEAP
ncbi:hypothetical protein [Ideonella paludis]|uniref:hypothetical protein n=1 Tax=Ideonella paludis TaxID=1233411 RepID=UPI00362C07CB